MTREAQDNKQTTSEPKAEKTQPSSEQSAIPEITDEHVPETTEQAASDPVVTDTVAEQDESHDHTDVAEDAESPSEPKAEKNSVAAKTHARKNRASRVNRIRTQKRWQKIAAFSAGACALIALAVSGISSQYFKGKVMPSVYVSGMASGAKTPEQLKAQLRSQQKQLTITFHSGEKTFTPKHEEIGLQLEIDSTVENALSAKRQNGFFDRVAFWKKQSVPAVISVNDTLLNQYIEANLPELSKPPTDSQLQFDAQQNAFVITPQADGEGADMQHLKQELISLGDNAKSTTIPVQVAVRKPNITEKKLQPLLKPANELVGRRVVLSGLGYTFRARPADIADWITPTPQKDGSLELVVDGAKVQSYVDSISKRISNAPVDRKVVKDRQTGAEVVIQEGRQGTELADKQNLAAAITNALKSGQDTTQTMNITTATFQTVNMEAYEKWIEVDLSEQRTTAYERATPIRNFTIASGTKGHETVVGEFAIWLKVRKQTMQGGSKADGSYYSIPNVEWVSYFYKDYALHGAWWREKFGYPASHGCVNMTNADAQWLYEWAPMGTKVIVHQ